MDIVSHLTGAERPPAAPSGRAKPGTGDSFESALRKAEREHPEPPAAERSNRTTEEPAATERPKQSTDQPTATERPKHSADQPEADVIPSLAAPAAPVVTADAPAARPAMLAALPALAPPESGFGTELMEIDSAPINAVDLQLPAAESPQAGLVAPITAAPANMAGMPSAGVSKGSGPAAPVTARQPALPVAEPERAPLAIKADSADAPVPTMAGDPAALGMADANQRGSQAAQAGPSRPAVATVLPAEQVVVHIARAAASGTDRIQIQLTPAALGRVDVDLSFGHDGRVDAVVRVDRPETLELLQRDARQLVRAFQEAGLQADGNSLNFQLRQDHDHRQPQFAAGGSDERRQNGSDADAPEAARALAFDRRALGGVDIRI